MLPLQPHIHLRGQRCPQRAGYTYSAGYYGSLVRIQTMHHGFQMHMFSGAELRFSWTTIIHEPSVHDSESICIAFEYSVTRASDQYCTLKWWSKRSSMRLWNRKCDAGIQCTFSIKISTSALYQSTILPIQSLISFRKWFIICNVNQVTSPHHCSLLDSCSYAMGRNIPNCDLTWQYGNRDEEFSNVPLLSFYPFW